MDFVLPPDMNDGSKVSYVEGVEYLCRPFIHGPGFAIIKEGRKDHSFVDFLFCCARNATLFPHLISRLPKETLDFTNILENFLVS